MADTVLGREAFNDAFSWLNENAADGPEPDPESKQIYMIADAQDVDADQMRDWINETYSLVVISVHGPIVTLLAWEAISVAMHTGLMMGLRMERVRSGT